MSATETITRITADNVASLFPDVDTSLAREVLPSAATSSATNSNELAGYDEEQVRLMDEVCIVLDDDDKPIGSASKKTCHLMTNIDRGLLHRAFSVFLFDSQKRLLLQQRASEKITFPDLWTNTCCSHPLGIPGETGSELDAAILGVKRAAQRKLDHELGIKPEQVPIEKFEFFTRIHYKAPSDGKWGEHEVDYILFIEADVDLEPNLNEVRDTRYVSETDLKEMFKQSDLKFTPWFKLICNSMLFEPALPPLLFPRYSSGPHQSPSIMDAIQKTLVDPLQPYLRPVVSAVPQPVHDAIVSLVGSNCHNTLLVNLDLAQNPECTSLAISKALGIGIVGASGIVKVPQILKLIRSGSSSGVSFVSYALETASLLITLSYGVRNEFPFSTYGESAFIAAQDVIVGVLVLTYAGRSAAAAAFIAVVAASIYALLGDTSIVDAQSMAYLQAGAGALGVASKVPQILTIWQEGGTGQLSAFAVFNYLAGSLSRIFTTLQEVDDKLILYGFLAGFSLNLILASQMLYYWDSPAQSKKQQAAQPKPKLAQRKPEAAPATRRTAASPSPKPSNKTPTTRRRG